jgi:hypothetical protein
MALNTGESQVGCDSTSCNGERDGRARAWCRLSRSSVNCTFRITPPGFGINTAGPPPFNGSNDPSVNDPIGLLVTIALESSTHGQRLTLVHFCSST